MFTRLPAAIALASIAVVLVCTAPASAFGPVGADPPHNFPLGPMPSACQTQPTGTDCDNAAISYLNQARASLGQPAYLLPTHFTTLTPAQQAFVLTNLDRTLYGLPVVPGLTDALNAQANTTGVQADADPSPPPGDNHTAYTTNWAAGYFNMPSAYESWMYDDGFGSNNFDCTSAGDPDCWGHRHDVLTDFDARTMAMGAAAGPSPNPSYKRGFAMLIVGGTAGTYVPSYSYTWQEAVADGAGVAPQTPPPSTSPVGGSASVKKVKVHGHTVKVRIAIPAAATAECALWRRGTPARKRRYRPCDGTAIYRHVKRGHYIFSVTTDTSSDSKHLKVG